MSGSTTQTANVPDTVIGPFDELLFARLMEGGEPANLLAEREIAFRAYQALPSPTSFDEGWRRTPPDRFPFQDIVPLPRLAPNGATGSGPWDNEFDVVVSVNDATYHVADRSGVLRDKRIFVMPLEEAASVFPGLVHDHVLGRALPPDRDKFVALNGAFWNFGLLVHIPPGVTLEKGILIRYAHQQPGAALIPLLAVVAGEGSEATIVETATSPDGVPFMTVSSKEFYVGDAARLRVISLQEWGRDTDQLGHDMAHVGRDAQVDWITLNFGSRTSKLVFGSDILGEGASAELDGLFFCDADQHIDQQTLQIHSAPNTYSRLLYKGAVQDQGHSVYQGIIQARPGAVKVDAYQTNNNLVLNDGAKADTIPGLLIDADDLKCSHGATIGNLNDDQVFYLRSRGLDESEARRILIRAFFDEVSARIPYDGIRERVHAIIDARLAAAK